MWVHARQYTGRIVQVSNAKIFDEAIYNYSSEFPYLWEEMRIPVPFKDDRVRAERILLDAAERHTVHIEELSEESLAEMERRYFMSREELKPRVYWRITDNWLELRIAIENGSIRDLVSCFVSRLRLVKPNRVRISP
jgi:small-conductance mechanosensitive channel